MQPIGKYIAVEIINEEIKTESGILLSGSDMNDIRYRKARIVEVGTDVNVLKANDVIYYDRHAGFTISVSGVQMTIILERDVVVRL